MASTSIFTSVENFFSGIGTDISNIAQNITKDITWVENEATAAEQWVVTNAPVILNGFQGLLQAAATATEAVEPAIGAIVAAGAAIVKDLESILETSASQGPGGQSTP